jgi:hypothetical protein
LIQQEQDNGAKPMKLTRELVMIGLTAWAIVFMDNGGWEMGRSYRDALVLSHARHDQVDFAVLRYI